MGAEPEWPPSGTDYSSKTQRERPKDEFCFLARTGVVMQEYAGTRGMNHAGRQHTPRKGLSLVRRTGNAEPAYRLCRPSVQRPRTATGLEQQRKLSTKEPFHSSDNRKETQA